MMLGMLKMKTKKKKVRTLPSRSLYGPHASR
jgi:hypothetical protein